MEVVEGDMDGVESGEIPLAQCYAVAGQVMGENDVSDVTAGAPDTPDAGTGREEGIEIVPVGKVEEAGEEEGLPQSAHGVSVHAAPGL